MFDCIAFLSRNIIGGVTVETMQGSFEAFMGTSQYNEMGPPFNC